MSGDEVTYAMEIIDEAFKDPIWIDHNSISSLSMLNLTKPEFNQLVEYINTKLYNYNEAALSLRNSLRRSVNGY
jgi:hypothetical protein